MTIDSTFTTMAACRIQPFKANFNDIDNVTHLGVVSLSDNLIDSCTFGWFLMNNLEVTYCKGSIDMTGLDYTNWNGDNLFPFSYIASKLNIILI